MKIARELKRGSAELLILSLVEERSRHGYDILQRLEERSEGVLKFHIGSVYPILVRMEKRGWIEGEWQHREGARRRRVYRITPAGRAVVEDQRGVWREIVEAVNRVARIRHA